MPTCLIHVYLFTHKSILSNLKLNERSSYIHYEKVLSNASIVNSGVPQVSVIASRGQSQIEDLASVVVCGEKIKPSTSV